MVYYDIDNFAWYNGFLRSNAMLLNATQQRPVEFQSNEFWYHFSYNIGIKPDISFDLWFWLERPYSGDQMTARVSGCPVDLGLFDLIQFHLTANPRFIDGAVDPYPNRSGLCEACS